MILIQLLLFCLLNVVFAGLYSDTIIFTGNAANDFTTNGALRKGVVVVEDARDVGSPLLFGDIVSGWDIERIFFHVDFE
jgi:hypothetical protein